MFNAHMDWVHGHQINYITEIYRDDDDTMVVRVELAYLLG